MSPKSVTLQASEVDDLVYLSRIGDLPSLRTTIDQLSQAHNCSALSITLAAIDLDDDGLGSGSCLLHYPAANGNFNVVNYLLDMIHSPNQSGAALEAASATANSTGVNQAARQFVNHQNSSGNTALHWAGMNGHLQVVQALIKAGADPQITNGAGRDAVVESEWSSVPAAGGCAVWMLKECEALEKGITGGDEDDGLPSGSTESRSLSSKEQESLKP